PRPCQMAVGVKETIALPPSVIEDRFLCAPGEGAAWMFAGDCTKGRVGGGFLYTNDDSISLGLVATLSDLAAGDVPIYQMLEDFKQRADIAPLVKGGELVEYSGHLVPEGGLAMVPRLYGDGVLVCGDAAMLCMNLGYSVRGMDFAVSSGDLAADAVMRALEADDVSAAQLAAYEQLLDGCYVLQDLKRFRRFPRYMEETTRIFNEYPAMARDIMLNLFKVDGHPQARIKDKLLGPLKRVGLWRVAQDGRKGMKAL
ncbi:MAG: FAD-dependent oxidoreductase, partial [Eggerthella lenta]